MLTGCLAKKVVAETDVLSTHKREEEEEEEMEIDKDDRKTI